MSGTRDGRLDRRGFLRASTAASVGLVGAGTAGTAAAQSAPFDGWLSDVSNYDGLHDNTGSGEVTVEVGVEANQGAFGFGPAAIKVDPGTTVTWEWTGEGGQHNVADDAGDFESELNGSAGHTFSHTFESEGVVKYFCMPHKALGMKGVVVVGDVDTGAEVVGGSSGSGGSGGSGDSGGSGGESGSGSASGSGGDGGAASGASTTMSLTIAGALVAAFLSPVAFGIALMLRDGGGAEPGHDQGDVVHED